jgi:hypothetical protein
MAECKQPPSMGAWGGGFRGACGGQENHAHTAVSSPSSQQQQQQQTQTQPQIPPTCGHCFKRCTSAALLTQHKSQARHSPHDPRCGACGKHFANFDTLRQHLDGSKPSQKCKLRYHQSGCPRCLAISPEGSPPHCSQGTRRCPFEIQMEMEPSVSSSSDAAAAAGSGFPGDGATATTRGRSESGGARRAAVALDCEMVGTEEDGSGAMCARVCLAGLLIPPLFHHVIFCSSKHGSINDSW